MEGGSTGFMRVGGVEGRRKDGRNHPFISRTLHMMADAADTLNDSVV